MGGAARRRLNRAPAVPAAGGTCSLCCSDLRDESTVGRLYTLEGTTVHYYCVLLSCCLVQRGDDEEGLFGFLIEDILAEIRRGSRLRCSYCSSGGATLGCSVGQCRKMFHLPCGRRRGALSLFYGNYKSYCIAHAPKQNVPAAIMAKAQARMEQAKMGDKLRLNGCNNNSEVKAATSPFKQLAVSESDGAETVCVICYEPVRAWPATDTFWPPCCARDSWFHTPCLQRMALSAGVHYLKCPLCNDKYHFQREATRRGVYIPDRDAAWELEEGAFSELYERPAACAADACACPHGRDHDADSGRWELKLCLMCGGAATHAGCAGAARFICARCSGVEPPSDLDALERVPLAPTAGEERSASPERRPLMTHRMSLRRTKPRAARRTASVVRRGTFRSEQLVRLASVSKNEEEDIDIESVNDPTPSRPQSSQNSQPEFAHNRNTQIADRIQNPESHELRVPGMDNLGTANPPSDGGKIPPAETQNIHVRSAAKNPRSEAPSETESRLSLGLRRPRPRAERGAPTTPGVQTFSPLKLIEARIRSLMLDPGDRRLRARIDEGVRRLRRPGPMWKKNKIMSDILEQIQFDCEKCEESAPRDPAAETNLLENVLKPSDTPNKAASNLDPGGKEPFTLVIHSTPAKDVGTDQNANPVEDEMIVEEISSVIHSTPAKDVGTDQNANPVEDEMIVEEISSVIHSTPAKNVDTDQNANPVEDEMIVEEISPGKDKENEDPQPIKADDVIDDEHNSNSSHTTFELPHEFLPQEKDDSFLDTPTKVVAEDDSSLEIFDDETQMYISYNIIDSVGYTEEDEEKNVYKNKTAEDSQTTATLENTGNVIAKNDSNATEKSCVSKALLSPTRVSKEIEEKCLKFPPKSQKIDVEMFKTHYLSEVESGFPFQSKLSCNQQDDSPSKLRLKNIMDFAIDDAVKNRKKYIKETKSRSDSEGFEAAIPGNTANVPKNEEKERRVKKIEDGKTRFRLRGKNKVEETVKIYANNKNKKVNSEKSCVKNSEENKRKLVDDDIRSTKNRNVNKPERYPSYKEGMKSNPRISKEKRQTELKTKDSGAKEVKKRKLATINDSDEGSSHSFIDEMGAIDEFYLRKEGKRNRTDKRRKEMERDRLRRKRWLMKLTKRSPAEGKQLKQSVLNFCPESKKEVMATPSLVSKIRQKRTKTEISPDGLKQTSLTRFFPSHLTLR